MSRITSRLRAAQRHVVALPDMALNYSTIEQVGVGADATRDAQRVEEEGEHDRTDGSEEA